MLKITVHTTPDLTRLTVEGRLTGPWIDELERVWLKTEQTEAGPLVMDLTGVTFMTEDGKALLSRMWRNGAVLVANGCCTGHMVNEITGRRPGADTLRCDVK